MCLNKFETHFLYERTVINRKSLSLKPAEE